MPLTALPVTQSDLTALQAGIAVFTDPTTAATVANQINTNTPPGTSVFSYATQLFQGQVGGTQIAMAVDSLIQGGVPIAGALQPVDKLDPTKNELQNLTVNPGQGGIVAASALGVKLGLDPIVFASESIAVGLAAGGDGTQNNFTKLWGGLPQATFTSTLSAQTGINASQITIWVNNWLSFYNGVGAAAIQTGLTATTQAYAATIGDAVGNAIKLGSGPGGTAGTAALSAAVFNALVDNAEVLAGTPGAKYQPGVSLFGQQAHIPLQGEVPPGGTVILTTNPDNVGPTQNAPFKTTPGTSNYIEAPLLGGKGTLQSADVIDGGAPGNGTVSTIGKFGQTAWFAADIALVQSPLVTNIQEIHALSSVPGGTLNFINVNQGTLPGQLTLAAISGTGTSGVPETNTTFSNLKLSTKVAVENIAQLASQANEFKFTGTTGTETVDLTFNKAGTFQLVDAIGGPLDFTTINGIGAINAHAIGNSGVVLIANTLTDLKVDGAGNLLLISVSGGAPTLKTVDASAMTGVFNYNGSFGGTTQPGITIKGSAGGSSILTDGSSPERIAFDAGKAAGDVWEPLLFNNVKGTAAQLANTGFLDTLSVQITNFQAGGTDKIDISFVGTLARTFISTPGQNAVGETKLDLKAAAEFAATNDGFAGAGPVIDVFQYKVGADTATYVFRDANNNNTVDAGDGFLKLVGVAGNTVQLNSFTV